MHKMCACLFLLKLIKPSSDLTVNNFFQLFYDLFALFIFSESILLSLTFCDLCLNSMTFQAWKLKLKFHDFPGLETETINSMTFQVFCDPVLLAK